MPRQPADSDRAPQAAGEGPHPHITANPRPTQLHRLRPQRHAHRQGGRGRGNHLIISLSFHWLFTLRGGGNKLVYAQT